MHDSHTISVALDRIRRMDTLFYAVLDALARCPDASALDPAVREKLHLLTRYYDSGEWLQDYERDERGELPAGLKRGVLSQDGLYDLLTRPELKLCQSEFIPGGDTHEA